VPKLSVTVITKNEASRLADALASVAWADEIVVVDSESSDDTVAVARRFTDRVVIRPWPGYVDQKNHAASIARHDWILSLDADERVTPELADEIKARLSTEPAQAAFEVPRVTWHLGRWIRTTDWYPDYQFRLYDRRRAEWAGRYVHETMTARGGVGRLRGELQHFAYRNLSDHLDTIDRYTTDAARQMFESGRRAGLLQMAGHPPHAFLRNYVLRGGFRDGAVGFLISALNSYYVFLKFAKLWELEQVQGSRFKVQGSHAEPGAPNPDPGPLKPGA
jgi:glycosyltransferase involved in cell wall biosynthesis